MKKVLSILCFLLFTLTGCITNSDYIETVKTMTFDDGTTVEEHVQNLVELGYVYENNSNLLYPFDSSNYALLLFTPPADFNQLLAENNFVMPKKSKLDWDIEGKTDSGKVVVASNKEYEVKIPTFQNGDYIQLYAEDMEVYSKKSKKLINTENLEKAEVFRDLAKEYDYEEYIAK